MKSELRLFWVFVMVITSVTFMLGEEGIGVGGYGVLCVIWVCGTLVTICAMSNGRW